MLMTCRNVPVGLMAIVLCLSFAASEVCLAKGEVAPKADKTGILLVTFGSTLPETQEVFRSLESDLQKRFPEDQIRWAYSSRKIRDKFRSVGNPVDSPLIAVSKMFEERFSRIVVASLHVIPGEEFHDLIKEMDSLKGLKSSKGVDIAVSRPLFSTRSGLETVAKAVIGSIPAERKKTDAVILLGHGSEKHPSDLLYAAFNFHAQKIDDLVFVTSVDGQPPFEEVVSELKAKGIKKAYLAPLMSVAGEHARNDMCGETKESLKSQLARENISVECVMKGIAEDPAVVAVWAEEITRAKNMVDKIHN